MATAYTNIDGLGLYLTGASIAGGSQNDPNACLGGHRSSKEVKRLGFVILPRSNLAPIAIDWIAGANGTGEATLRAASGTTLQWVPPSGTATTAISIAHEETKLVESATAAKSVRVTQDIDATLKGTWSLQLIKVFNGVLGMDNVTSAERAAGLNTYRAIMLRAHGPLAVTSVKVWLKTLGTQRTSDVAQLGGSGSGSVQTSGSLADWPEAGWCRIQDSGGTLREIVYYTSRTLTTLTVPAAGRGRLGTSATAGAATDTINAVPGIRIASESPVSDAIQTIANDATAPSGVTWNTAITSAGGLSIASISSGSNYGLWIHREIPAGATVAASQENAINVQFVYNSVTYDDSFSGLYRIEDSSKNLYELYVGEDADPTYSSAATTSATLPFTHALTPPVSGTKEFRLVCRKRNSYNLSSYNQWVQARFKIDSTGALVTQPPTAPDNIQLVNTAGGKLLLTATYMPGGDDPQANSWAIRMRGDGVDPDGSETPTYEEMRLFTGLIFRGTQYRITKELGPFAYNQDVRVLLRTRHAATNTESTNTTAATATVSTNAPSNVRRRSVSLGNAAELRIADPTIARTVYIDEANNIRWLIYSGYTELWGGATLIWRIKYDSAGAPNNGIWTTFDLVQDTTISGTPSVEPIEVAAWNGTKTLYVSSNGVRRMKFDVTNSRISFEAFNENVLPVVSVADEAPIYDAEFHTLFQVFDPNALSYVTAVCLDYDGVLRSLVPWRQRATTGAFE